MLHLRFFLRSCGGVRRLTETTGGAQERRFVGGSQRIADLVAARLGPRIQLGSPVVALQHDDHGVTVRTDDGATLRAHRAVLAVPPALAVGIDIDPAPSQERLEVVRRWRHGSVVKVNVVYDRPWWRDDGLSGQAATVDGPVSATFDNSPPAGSPGILLCFVEADHSRRLRELDESARRHAVIDALVALFGSRATEAREVIVTDWTREPWTRGCYGAHPEPGTWSRLGHVVRQPIGPIHVAGTETATRWYLYMDGAVGSGERAAREILRSSRTGGEINRR
jgi:monoamine oxidase